MEKILSSKKSEFTNSGFWKYFNNSTWLVSERILRMSVNLVVSVYIIRYLGPNLFGQLSYAQSFVGLFTAIAILGLDAIIVRELVKTQSRQADLLGTAFTLKIAGALFAICFIAISIQFVDITEEEKILIYIISSGLLFQAANTIDCYFQSRVQSRYVVQAQIVQLIISVAIKIVLIIIAASLVWFAIVIVLEGVILALGLSLNYFRVEKNLGSWRFSAKTAKNLLRDSWPNIISGIAITLYMRIDQIMIHEMLGNTAVGQYAAAVRISEAWYFIPIAITSSLFPAIINTKNVDSKIYYQRLQRLYCLMAVLAIIIAIPTTFLADWLVTLLFNPEYLLTGGVLAIHVWAGLFVSIGVANNKSLLVENLQIQIMVRTIIGSIINILLNLILIPEYGIKGAAVATIISYLISAYLTIPMYKGQWSNFILATKAITMIGLFGSFREKSS